MLFFKCHFCIKTTRKVKILKNKIRKEENNNSSNNNNKTNIEIAISKSKLIESKCNSQFLNS